MRLRLARHPSNLSAARPLIIDDLLALAANDQHEGLSAILEMLADLHQNGHQSRYVRALKGLPLFELKTTRRGGQKGGARVYFFFAKGEAVIINCEVKKGEEASEAKLVEALEVLVAYNQGVAVV